MPAEQDPKMLGRTVVGLFSSRADAEEAVRELKNAGFSEEQIGIALQDQAADQPGTGNEVAAGATTGAVSGGIVGGLVGLLGSLLVPGVGPIVVGGVLASTLTGAGVGAAAGGVIGALTGLGLSTEEARHFEAGIRSGGVLVTVDAGTRTDLALDILRRHSVDLGPADTWREDRSRAATATDVGAPGLTGSGVLGIGGDTYAPSGLGLGSSPGIGAADVASGSSTGDRGMSGPRPWRGTERRRHADPAYTGPERRLVGV